MHEVLEGSIYPWVVIIGCVAGLLGLVTMTIFNCMKRRREREKWNNAGNDVVVLHQFWRGKFSPSLSPFVLKVESFMRMYNIKYVSDFTEPFGPTGLCPWMTLNGEDTCDSTFIIRRLVDHFGITLDLHLTPERRASLDCARIMLEDQIFWIVYLWRYKYDDKDRFLSTQVFPSLYVKLFFKYMLGRHAHKRATAQGMARHSEEEQFKISCNALDNLKHLYGSGPYFGGEKPSSADCCFFGFLSQLIYNEPGSKYQKLFNDEYPQLQEYCYRMKDLLFPDWGQLLNPPHETSTS